LGYFVWKITILRKKNHIFSNFRGSTPARASPLDPPLHYAYDKHNPFSAATQILCNNLITTIKHWKWRLQLTTRKPWISSLLSATLYRGNPHMKQKLFNIVSTKRDTLFVCMCCCVIAITYKWKMYNGRFTSSCSVCVVSLSIMDIIERRRWSKIRNNKLHIYKFN
jgi:hypothetical protein